jgi:hypothetical protein
MNVNKVSTDIKAKCNTVCKPAVLQPTLTNPFLKHFFSQILLIGIFLLLSGTLIHPRTTTLEIVVLPIFSLVDKPYRILSTLRID